MPPFFFKECILTYKLVCMQPRPALRTDAIKYRRTIDCLTPRRLSFKNDRDNLIVAHLTLIGPQRGKQCLQSFKLAKPAQAIIYRVCAFRFLKTDM